MQNFGDKVKRTLSVAAGACMMLTLSSSVVAANDSEADTKKISASDAAEFYETVVSQPNWKNTGSRVERGEMVQLPENMLSELSTDDLIEAVLDYPFFVDVYAFNDVHTAVDIMYDSFNGLRELTSRLDLVPALMEKYRAEPVAEKNSGDDIFRLDNIEILLSQDFVTDKLSDDNITELSELILDKREQKAKSELYGEFSVNLICDLLGIESDCHDLKAEIQMALK